MSIFETLNNINVNDRTEKKGKLTYLSWAWAWGEVKKMYPAATFTIYERETEFGPVNYFTDGRTCWVKTGLTIEGLEHIEELPVMDYNNRSITLDKVTSTDVNKSIQRSLTKAAARHGLGLYIYAGEDLPEAEQGKAEAEPKVKLDLEAVPFEKVERPAPKPAKVTQAAKLPEKKPDPAGNYIMNVINDIQEKLDLQTYDDAKSVFMKWVNALIEAGILGPVDWKKITMDEAKNIADAVYKNFRPGDAA